MHATANVDHEGHCPCLQTSPEITAGITGIVSLWIAGKGKGRSPSPTASPSFHNIEVSSPGPQADMATCRHQLSIFDSPVTHGLPSGKQVSRGLGRLCSSGVANDVGAVTGSV